MKKPSKYAVFALIVKAVILVSALFIGISVFARLFWFPSRPALFSVLALGKMEYITWGIGLLTAFVIFTQLILLQNQMATQTLIEFSRAWNDPITASKRKEAVAALALPSDKIGEKIDCVEGILEVLEDFSTFARREVVDKGLVWDSTLGWYAVRYFHYADQCGALKYARSRWCIPPNFDPTLYENLEWLYGEYLKREAHNREIDPESLKNEYDTTKQKFIESEGTVSAG